MPRLISDRTANDLAELLRAPPARAGQSSGALSVSCLVAECGALIGSSPRPHYNATVQWMGSLSGPSDATGAADGVILADLDAGTLTPGSVYIAYLSGTASDGRPILWCRRDSSGGTGGCAGCGWVAGLTELDCLLATVVERLGRCECGAACVDTDTGAQFPGTVAGMGDMPDTWAFTERLTDLDDLHATCDLPAGSQSETLSLTDFGISVPDGATIKGIKIEVLQKHEGEGGRHVVDYLLHVYYPGGFVTVGPDTTVWPDELPYLNTTYGGPTSLLGRDPGEWTPAQVNDLEVRFRAYNDPEFTEGTGQARIDAFRVTVYYCTTGDAPATGDGPVYLTSADGEDWTATGDGSTITICGVEYALTFSREGCDGPCLTLTSGGGSGASYTAVRDCCGCNYAIFAIGTPDVCSGTTDTEAGPCGNIARIKVEWSCCPIEGWAGAGYYCVRDAGTEDDCTPVELTDADKCDDTIEICSGPYSTLAVAEAACGEPEPVDAPCQGVSWVDATYTFEVLDVGTCPHGDESGTVSPLSPTYPGLGTDGAIISLPIWTGTEHYFYCASGQYRLTVGGPMGGNFYPIYFDAGPPVVIQWFVPTGDGVLSCYGGILTVTQSAP